MSARHRAISPASPPSSAAFDSAAPAVSITVTSGSPSSAASRMPRRAIRSPAGPSGALERWLRRSCPSTTAGAPPNRASASSNPGSFSPAPVPFNGVTSRAASFSNDRTPGRSSRRDRLIASHASTGRRSSSGGSPGRSPDVSAHSTDNARAASSRASSAGTTASTRPCRNRFSASCTPSGNG